MGIGRKFGRKILDGLRKVNREASHPGRPPSYKATDSPFWDEPARKSEELREAARRMAKTGADEVGIDEPEAPEPKDGGNLKQAEGEELPWYLQGEEDLDGWDNTYAHDAD